MINGNFVWLKRIAYRCAERLVAVVVVASDFKRTIRVKL
jgi:hypothetical protein